jgi:hypothetical protein
LTFLQGLVTLALQRREVNENVLSAAVRLDESKSLTIIEPFDLIVPVGILLTLHSAASWDPYDPGDIIV